MNIAFAQALRDNQSGAERTARIARGRRKVNFFERGLESDFAVGHRVLGTAAGECQIG